MTSATLTANGVQVLISGARGAAGVAAGQGALIDLSNATFKSGLAGSVSRLVLSKLGDQVSVLDFGALGNGVADDTAAVQAAINATQGSQRALLFPGGHTYLISQVVVTGSLILRGAGAGSIISASSATLDTIAIENVGNDPGCVVEDLYFTAAVTRTTAAFVSSISAQGTKVRRCRFDNAYNGITVSGSVTQGLRIQDCVFVYLLNVGIFITAFSAGPVGIVDGMIENCFIVGTGALANAAAGVLVTNCGDLQLRHVSTIFCSSGLGVAPPTGNVIQSLVVTDSYFDTGSGNGINIAPTGGTVQLMKVSDTWSASNTLNGALVGGTGAVLKLDFINCTLSNNGQDGLSITNAAAAGVQFIGGSAGANAGAGFHAAAGVSHFKLIGSTLGTSGQFGPNAYGVHIEAGASDFYIIADNEFVGNTTANFADSGTGIHKKTSGNVSGGGAIRSSAQPNADWGVDFTSQGAISLTPAANYVLAVGSGLVAVHNDGTGDMGLFMLYAGNVQKLGGGATIVSGAPAASQIGLQWTGAAYEVTNGYGSTQSLYVSTLKTRPAN